MIKNALLLGLLGLAAAQSATPSDEASEAKITG